MPDQPAPTVIFNLGMGVDSAAILLRYLTDPTSRDFDLNEMVVITAMTGDEFASTGRDVEQHILPLMRDHNVRYVQVARGRRHVTTAGDGIVILSDTRQPHQVHLNGAYKLSTEMLEAGTIPQSGGARLCSVHAKGDALDPIIAQITAGRPYRQIIVFEANEPKRADKDAGYNTALRTGMYPLIEWGWNRQRCIDYIQTITGIVWEKSACTGCPFSFQNTESRVRLMGRYRETPDAGIDTLFMEHVALCLNPTQGLVSGKRAADIIHAAGLTEVTDGLADRLNHTGHAIYEVRRILRPRNDDPTKMANAARSVTAIAAGTRTEMLAELDRLATELHTVVTTGDDNIGRVHIRTRGTTFPTVEQFYVVCPDVVLDKQHTKFDSWWTTATATELAAA